MPRKFLRRLLPSHEKIRENRYVAWFGPHLQHHNLWHLNRRAVAGGVAAGLFAGLIPGSNPIQFTAGALLAIGFRVNLPLAVLVTLYSNPFTILPLYVTAYGLGQYVLFQRNGVPRLPVHLTDQRLVDMLPAFFEWLVTAGKPLLVGLPLLALLLAVAGYCAVDWTWRMHVRCTWWRRRRRRAAPRA